jgi:hypothetical protein
VIVRLLLLIVAMLLVAAPAERARAELCPDAAAELAAADAPVVAELSAPAPPLHVADVLPPPPITSIAPAPIRARIFRPPRRSSV